MCIRDRFRDVFPWKAGLLTFSPMQSAVTPSPTTCPNETQQQKKTARTKIVSAQSVIWLWVSRRYFRMISPISGLLTLLTAASRRHTFSADPPAQTHDDNIIENGPHKAPLSAQAAVRWGVEEILRDASWKAGLLQNVFTTCTATAQAVLWRGFRGDILRYFPGKWVSPLKIMYPRFGAKTTWN